MLFSYNWAHAERAKAQMTRSEFLKCPFAPYEDKNIFHLNEPVILDMKFYEISWRAKKLTSRLK